MTFISYASNFEDVLLNRVFSGRNDGFYIDIGADHPVFSSTTKAFYDRGWRGINVEPGPAFTLIEKHRPRDINIRAAIADFDGETDFYVNDDLLATSSIYNDVHPSVAARSKSRSHHRVPAMTLATLTRLHPSGRRADFLKIDAEGAEGAIIRGGDWKTFRPRIVLAESTEPFSTVRVDGGWAGHLARNGYREAYFDGINTWFVREENPEDLTYFDVPVNLLDDFIKYDPRHHDFRGRETGSPANARCRSALRRLRRSAAKRLRKLAARLEA